MKKHRKPRKRISEKIVKKLDIPEDIIFDIPRITMMANKEIRIENFTSVLEYATDKIALRAKNTVIELYGSELNINLITDEEISVSGLFVSVNFSELGS